ncbi:MAG TPA: SCO family protein [Candidatus Acidoferrales bacterium]|nr:SCO family protein [Candidatus Acidoferrales bacterium]
MSEPSKLSMRIGFNACKALLAAVAVAAMVAVFPAAARAQFTDPIQNIGVRPELLKQVGVDQKLNAQVPLALTFRDEHGATVQLGQFFAGKPVVLSLVYFTCPMLCTQLLNGVERGLKQVSLEPGKDFNLITVSIDPSDTPADANAKHALYTGLYGNSGAPAAWHFLTGAEPQIKALADSVGFRYAYDAQSKQFAHASVVMLLTPEGRISKYFYGINFSPRDLRLGLVQASEGKIGTPADQVLLFCYHYDPHTGKYGLLISHLLALAGLLTVVIGGVCLVVLFRGEHYELPEGKA